MLFQFDIRNVPASVSYLLAYHFNVAKGIARREEYSIPPHISVIWKKV
jgi:hypothetical protein